MPPFRDASIRTKLTLLMVAVVSLVVVLLCIAFMVNDVRVFRASMADQQSALADVLGANSTAALDFADDETGQEVLSSLRLEPTVVFACTYDANGGLFARYRKEGVARTAPELPDTPGGPFFEGGHLHVFKPITQEGQTVGTIYLCGSTEEIQGRLRYSAYIMAAVLCSSLLFVVLIASRLQRVISKPILRLVGAMETVSAQADYSIRVKKSGGDELGTLCDGFNEMLAQLQSRDAELEAHRNHLEELVQARTGDLEARSQELARTNIELERSNKDLDDFAYIASHDLKEPLRGISNFAEFLAEDYEDQLDADGREKLKTLQRLCLRMEALIDSLLHFSRVGRADLAIQEADLDKLVREILESLQVTLESENVEVRIPRPLPTITCDPVRVGEAFRNLITNAVKYNDKPERWIEIGFQGAEKAAARAPGDEPEGNLHDPLVFYVRDNGIGIREKHLADIFRIFRRLHGRDKYGGGTGAGLTFVKQIAERHGGRVWVESQGGQGSTFYFTLQPDSRVPPHEPG